MMDNKKNSPTASHLWQGFLPFAIYIAVNDLVQIILSFLTDKWIEQGFAFSEVLREYAGNVTLITHLIAAFLGYYAVVRLTGPGPKLMVKPKNHEIAGITGAPETTGAAGTTGDKEDRDVYLLQVLFAVLGAVSLALAVNIGFGILGALDTTNDSSFAGTMYNVSLAPGILVYGVFIPYVEEMLFRGIIFGRIREKMGPAAAVLLSAALFAIMHGSLTGAVYAFLMGCVFAVTYEYLRWIAVPCLCHAAANTVIFIITFFGAFGKLINVGRFAEFLVIAAVSPAVVLRGPEFMRYWKRRQN